METSLETPYTQQETMSWRDRRLGSQVFEEPLV
jgi:hypothetical protein